MVMKYLLEDSVVRTQQVFTPEIASYELVTCIHTPLYTQQLFSGTLPAKEMRKTGFHWTEGLVERCRLEVGKLHHVVFRNILKIFYHMLCLVIEGGTLAAAEIALERGLACSTGGGTHHAFPTYGSGFCLVNDLAITAQHLLDQGRVRNVMIVDLDVHQVSSTYSIAFPPHEYPNLWRILLWSHHCPTRENPVWAPMEIPHLSHHG